VLPSPNSGGMVPMLCEEGGPLSLKKTDRGWRDPWVGALKATDAGR